MRGYEQAAGLSFFYFLHSVLVMLFHVTRRYRLEAKMFGVHKIFVLFSVRGCQ